MPYYSRAILLTSWVNVALHFMTKEPIFIQKTPWFYFLLKLLFPGINRDTIITLGHKVYCRNKLSPDLWEHEKVHCEQQELAGPVWFLVCYLTSAKFRLEMELEAYRKQYQFINEDASYKHRGRIEASKALEGMAADLSGSMYGRIVGYYEAIDLIRNDNEQF